MELREIKVFLSTDRATPNPNTSNATSSAEALMNRKVCLLVDAIHPAPKCSYKINRMIEKQFNCQHGVVPHLFIPGQPVLDKDYCNGKEK